MANDRISFEQLEDETVLVCRSAERLDEGSYTVTLRNVKGSDTATICVTTLDKPARRRDHLRCPRLRQSRAV